MYPIITTLLNSLCFGLILALVSLGLTILFGWLQVINVAHGVLYTLGAIICYYCVTYLNYFSSFLFVPIFLTGVALLLYLCLMRFIFRKENPIQASLLVSYGLMFVLEQIYLLTYGGVPRKLIFPLNEQSIIFFNIQYSLYRIFAVMVSSAIIMGMFLLLNRSTLGIQIRAVKQDQEIAIAMGANAEKISIIVYVLGIVLAGLGGVLNAPITGVFHTMGGEVIIDAFLVVILAGLGNIKGTIVSSLIYAFAIGFFSFFFIPTLAKVAAYALLILVIYLRPSGLFMEV